MSKNNRGTPSTASILLDRRIAQAARLRRISLYSAHPICFCCSQGLLEAPFILNHPLVIAPIAIPVAADALVVITFMIIGEPAVETAEKTAAETAQGISKTVSWLSDKAAELFEAIKA